MLCSLLTWRTVSQYLLKDPSSSKNCQTTPVFRWLHELSTHLSWLSDFHRNLSLKHILNFTTHSKGRSTFSGKKQQHEVKTYQFTWTMAAPLKAASQKNIHISEKSIPNGSKWASCLLPNGHATPECFVWVAHRRKRQGFHRCLEKQQGWTYLSKNSSGPNRPW